MNDLQRLKLFCFSSLLLEPLRKFMWWFLL